jgi:hypothetical protein
MSSRRATAAKRCLPPRISPARLALLQVLPSPKELRRDVGQCLQSLSRDGNFCYGHVNTIGGSATERAVVRKTCSMLAADVASILSNSNTTTALAAPHAPRPASSSHLPSNTNTQPTTLPRSTFTESATQTNHHLFVQSGMQTESMTVVQSSTQTNDTSDIKLLEERVSHLENTTTLAARTEERRQ